MREATAAPGAPPADLPQLDMAELLAMIPVPNTAVRPHRHGKTLILYVPYARPWWMKAMGWIPGVHFRPEKGVALDGLGEEVWQACDGERTAEQIIEAFADRHSLRFQEARLSVMSFLQMLLQRNLIVLAAKMD